ncbi:MAG: class I SAM-dependent methyltransferase [Deltaproteobacteria bacterium]|nr:class I SAM-dependent methyltransferase [Deltaproteobacteria bacterium]
MQKEKHWSRFANDFEKRVIYVAGKQNILAIEKTLGEQRLKGKVLELGCGNGTYSEALARYAQVLHITDLSHQMVSFCQSRHKNLKNVVVERQDCFNLSYAAGKFNAVVMVNLLHIIPNPEAALIEARRVLQPEGTIVVVSFTSSGMSFFSKLGMMYRYFRAYGKPPAGSRVLDVDSISQMLKCTGFSVVSANLMGTGAKAVFARAIVS